MSTKEPRIKISQDRTRICKYCIGDRVIVSFRKYGVKKFEAEVTEVCENMHGLDGVWISVMPLKALDPTDKTAQMYVDQKINLGDKITVSLDYEEDNSNIVPNKLDLDIVYEDDGLLVINKPSGIPVHPSILHYEDSLSNGVKFYFDQIGLKKKIRPVNRIDKDTSGLVIFAKCEYIQEELIVP